MSEDILEKQMFEIIQNRDMLEYIKLAKMEMLISLWLDVNAKNSEGQTPLICASSNGNQQIVEYLISKGADVKIKDNDSEDALYKAVNSKHKDVAELLISNGADIDNKNRRGWTALRAALSWDGDIEIAKFLISKGANLNIEDHKGQTILMEAAFKGQTDIARLLISSGADIYVKDKSGKTAKDIAFNCYNKEIAMMLQEKMDGKSAQRDHEEVRNVAQNNGGFAESMKRWFGR